MYLMDIVVWILSKRNIIYPVTLPTRVFMTKNRLVMLLKFFMILIHFYRNLFFVKVGEH